MSLTPVPGRQQTSLGVWPGQDIPSILLRTELSTAITHLFLLLGGVVMRWLSLSDCGDLSGVTGPSSSSSFGWPSMHKASCILCRGPWGVMWAKDDFACHPEWTWTTLHALLSLQLLPSPCWEMNKGCPWSWIISDVCFCLRRGRAWLHQSISLFDSLMFLNLSASYCNWYQAEQVVHLVTFDTTGVSATVQWKAHVLSTAWNLNSSWFFGSCAWVATSFLASINDLSPLQVDSIPGLSWQGQWPPPKLAARAALPQCPSCLPCLHKVLCRALDNAPHPVCPWAWELLILAPGTIHTHKADLYKFLPMDQNGTGSSPILLAYLLNFGRLSVQTYWYFLSDQEDYWQVHSF